MESALHPDRPSIKPPPEGGARLHAPSFSTPLPAPKGDPRKQAGQSAFGVCLLKLSVLRVWTTAAGSRCLINSLMAWKEEGKEVVRMEVGTCDPEGDPRETALTSGNPWPGLLRTFLQTGLATTELG